MSYSALFDTTLALREHLLTGLPGLDRSAFHLSIPEQKQMNGKRILLYPFHLEVNAELRNSQQLTKPSQGLSQETSVLPLNVRYLLAVFAEQGGQGEPDELILLGRMMQRLETAPQLVIQAEAADSNIRLPQQVVSFRPEYYPMEELSRIWSLFPQEYYRTSVVYTASPVHIEARPAAEGERITRANVTPGAFNDIPGRREHDSER